MTMNPLGHRLTQWAKRRMSRPTRVVSLALLTTLLVGQSPSAWSRTSTPAEATRVAQSVPEFEPLTIMGVLDENSQVWDDGRSFNVHPFEGRAGQIVVIDLISDEFDAYLLLLNSDNVLIAWDDDDSGTNARITLTLPTSGTYSILANSFAAGETGNYQLTVQPETTAGVEQAEPLAEATRLNDQGIELYQAGRYGEAESLFQELLRILRERLGDRHPDVATSLNNLAALYQEQGRYGEAEPLYQESLDIYRERLGDRHPDVATSLDNLASLYQEQGRYGEAEPLYQESLAIRREQLGDRHLSVATSLNNLASLYQEQGRYGEAEPLYQESLAIRREQLGDRHPDVATSLNNLAGLYQAQGNYAAAEPLFQRSLQIRETALGDRHPSVASSLNNLAVLYRQQGNYSAAEPLYQQSLQIREMELGESHPDVALSLSNMAQLYRAQGNYTAAEPLYQRAIQIREVIFGETHPSVANSLIGLAGLYLDLGNYTAAELLYERALQIYEPTFGETHPNVAIGLDGLSDTYRLQGNYVLAEQLARQALQIREATLGETHLSVATSLNNLAVLYQDQGDYISAETAFQQALQIRETVLGEDHLDVALSLGNLAGLYAEQGDYTAAEALYQRSLQIRETALGENHPSIANSLNNLAAVYNDLGDYITAEQLYQRSLQILESTLGETHPNVAKGLNGLALLYMSQGNYTAAEPLLEQALQILETALGETHPDVAANLNNLALLYVAQRNYSAAEPLYERSLQIYTTSLDASHPSIAKSSNNLAELHRLQGNYAAAIPLFERSLQILEATFDENYPSVAVSLNGLALIYKTQGDYNATEPLFQRSLQILETALGETHPDVATNLNNLVELYQAQGNIPQSLAFLQQGLEIEETNLALNLAIGSEERKQAYLATLSGPTSATISFHLQFASNNTEAAQLALTTVLRRKGRILDAVTDTQQLLRQNLSPDLAPLLDEFTAVQTQLATQLYGGLGDQNPEVYRARIDQLRQEANRLENELSRRSAEFRVETEPVEIEAVQALIPADAALVELVQYQPFDPAGGTWGAPRYAAYILRSTGDPQWVDLGDAEAINTAARAFLAAARTPNNLTRARTTARALDELVMAPIRPLLGDATHLLLSPDSQLNLIPFAALLDEQDRYLVERYTLTHLTTGRDLLRLQNPAPSQQPPVIFANPNYDTADSSTTQIVAAATAPSASPRPRGEGLGVRAAQRSADIADLRFGPLPGTQQEVDAIAPLLPDNAIILTEAAATENALKQVQAPSILHIATHGFFLEDVEFVPPESTRGTATIDILSSGQPAPPPTRRVSNENPLLRSGLAFSGFNPRDSAGEDGVLTALEATRLNLRGTRLVVMSACETGVGQVANGEGVYGLRRAFVMAGAESQLMSLWKVDDIGTAELMQRYYELLLDGEGRSEALRQVQLEFLEAPAYQHPYYWASFLFSGEWRPLD